MGVFKGFTFDGISSLDYGIYTTGTSVYNAPERDVEMIEIAGKNGALAIDNGRWQNIEVTYTCSTFAQDSEEFAEKIRDFINEICSRVSYVRLTDDYNPDEYRLALYRTGVDVEAAARNKAGEFDLVFECKPQRFLISGEEMITVGDWGDVTEYSGDIVTFEADEMTAIKSLGVALSPVQNLNGYDHPWVGGAGKNLLKPTQRTTTANGVTYTVAADGKVTLTGTASGDTSFTLYTGQTLKDDGAYTCSLYGATNAKVNGGASHTRIVGAGTSPSSFAITITNGTVYNESFFVQIEKGTTATAYEPYENICPITGWDGVSVTRVGINVWDEEYKTGTYNTGTGVFEPNNTHLACKNPISVKPNTDYRYQTNGYKINVCYLDAEQNCIGNFNSVADVIRTTPNDCYYIVFNMAMVYGTTYNHDISINYTATDTSYHAYNGETITQEFVDDQGNTLTVYGGESEIVGGVLTVDRAVQEVPTNGNIVTINDSICYRYTNADLKTSGIRDGYECSHFKRPSTFSKNPNNGEISNQYFNYYNMTLRNDSLTTLEEWNAWLTAQRTAGTPVTVVYKLATPITYTLTPQQVETFIGTNNIWSDAGEVTVEVADDPNKIVNPTLYDAKPLIKVSGYGTVQVGSVTITIEGSASDVTYIDCDSMECYRLNGLAIVSANSAVSFSSYDFPVLEADAITGVTYSTNISQVQIVPRWWQL